jgi:hypothetical protein
MQDEDDILDDREMPDPSDMDDESDGAETEPCPYCRRPVYEQVEACPHCGNFISREDAPPRRFPLWVVISAVVCIAIVLLVLLR